VLGIGCFERKGLVDSGQSQTLDCLLVGLDGLQAGDKAIVLLVEGVQRHVQRYRCLTNEYVK